MNVTTRRALDWRTLLLIFWSTTASVGSQLVLRHGMSSLSDRSGVELALLAAGNPWILAGLLIFALGAASWLVVLSRIDLSVAYPLGALNYVLVTVMAATVLGEMIPLIRWMGVLLILCGILLIAFSERHAGAARPEGSG
jgi:drug/metabolite transporter (DMT)-like permease